MEAKFEDVVQTLIETNNKLIKGEISIDVAKQVAISTQTIINAGRLQLDICKEMKELNGFINPKKTAMQVAIEAEKLNHLHNDDILDSHTPIIE